MITLFQANKHYPLNEIKNAVRQHLQNLPQMIAPTGTPQIILRFEFPTEDINFFSWLHNQTITQKIYWSGRDADIEMAGVSAADVIKGDEPKSIDEVFNAIEDKVVGDNTRIRYYGGFRFSPERQDAEWGALGAYQFIVPRFEMYRENNPLNSYLKDGLAAEAPNHKTYFVFNVLAADINPDKVAEILKEFDTLDFNAETHYRKPPQVSSRQDFPDKNKWTEAFHQAMAGIKSKTYEKIVLARRSVFNFDKAIDPIALLKHLKDVTPNSFHFCIQTDAYHGFLGATPERLFKLNDNQLESEAVAGTTERGKNKEEDAKLEKELLSSKNTTEHQYVVKHIESILKSECQNLNVDNAPQLLKLSGHQHLITRFKATTKTDAQELLTKLHPTPAVAGFPTKKATETIQKIEPFDRGWYAGPIGYIGRYKSEFAVAIRSALVEAEKLSLYAGAGIIASSDCDKEWNEIENKISNFIKVFYQA